MSVVNESRSSFGQLTSPSEVFFGMRTLFYACTPNETSYGDLEDVPPIINRASPFFFSLIFLEIIVLILKGKKSRIPRYNDTFSSLAAGLVSQLPLLFGRSIEISAYVWFYDNFCVYALPWNSPWTWVLTMLGVDLGYYWVHRFAHEINFMWAGHQTHHSSEEYNLTTALRQGLFQRYSSWIFYLPMALFIPPSMFSIHIQLNILYQFWIHTETIGTLGPLEYVLNTPSHHRVHHGVNRYCIDKNYAGVLIIWDRMFGTFEAERKEDEVVYGLTHQLNSWNPVYTQTSQWMNIFSRAWNIKGLSNKLFCLLKGPGWEPGKPRLGLVQDIPDVHAPANKFNKTVKGLLNVYCVVHFFLTLALYETLVKHQKVVAIYQMLPAATFILWSLLDIGMIYENRTNAEILEVLRCGIFVVFDLVFISSDFHSLPVVYRALRFGAMFSLVFMIGKMLAKKSLIKKSD